MKAALILGLAVGLIASPKANADGCFVMPPFVWNKAKDINEPTQKAIIVHDAGREDLILQVKYEGPVEEFGWLIPVPGLPTVQKGSMECFYELSRYTQEHFEPRYRSMTLSAGSSKGEEKPEPVKVIEVKTVGAYEVAVLSANSVGSLENWLNENHFSFPPDKADIIDSYIKQQWYFVAAKINLRKSGGFQLVSGAGKQARAGADSFVKGKLAKGELHPLHISFETANCVYPLKISSINGQPSEVQVYVLSPEPLMERRLFEKKLPEIRRVKADQAEKRRQCVRNLRMLTIAWQMYDAGAKPNISEVESLVQPETNLLERADVNPYDLLPYGLVTEKELPKCGRQIPRLAGKSWWLTKQTWTFKPEEMSDLEFRPAIPVFEEKLATEDGFEAAANLAGLKSKGIPFLLTALKSTNDQVRIHVASVFEQIRDERIVPYLPAMLMDSQPEVRLYGVFGVMNHWDPKFVESLVGLLRDEYGEVGRAAGSALERHREEASKHISAVLDLLKEENPVVQMSAIKLLTMLQVKIPRQDLLRLFKVPRLEIAGAAYSILRQQDQDISNDEAMPLLQNSALMPRLIGLKILGQNANKQSIELAIPLLKDQSQIIRDKAHRVLRRLTGQDIPPDQLEKWEEWWAANKATFTPKPLPSESQQMGSEGWPPPSPLPR